MLHWRTSAPLAHDRPVGGTPPPTGRASTESIFRSTALTGFLASIRARPATELIDVGPVIGSNIEFLGEHAACKIHIEDLYADLDRHVEQQTLDRLPDFFRARFPLASASIDGVLCWDLFDYLDAPAASALAGELMRMLRPGGALLAFFGTVAHHALGYTKYVIEDVEHLRCLASGGAVARRRVLENRDIIRLLEHLDVSHSVLLKSHTREMLFRKRAASA